MDRTAPQGTVFHAGRRQVFVDPASDRKASCCSFCRCSSCGDNSPSGIDVMQPSPSFWSSVVVSVPVFRRRHRLYNKDAEVKDGFPHVEQASVGNESVADWPKRPPPFSEFKPQSGSISTSFGWHTSRNMLSCPRPPHCHMVYCSPLSGVHPWLRSGAVVEPKHRHRG